MSDYILSTVCTGIGSPEEAAEELDNELGISHKIGFYCEIDKYARKTYEANFNAGFLVPDMTQCHWDGNEYYSDLFIGGIPCQAFSLAGLRKGELDPRGLLIYDYIRYVKKHLPKAFIIENVKGLLSDSGGKTFQNWLHLLGQSVNGHYQMFNHPDSLPYNLHWTVLNSKDFGVPQNRERVFIVAIRNDLPNTFSFPPASRLTVRLKDILEPNVDEKYYLSEKALEYLNRDSTGNWSDRLSMLNHDNADTAGCITANHAKGVPYNMLSETIDDPKAGRIVGRNPENPKARVAGQYQEQTLEQNENPGITNTLTTVQKDNVIIQPTILQTNISGENFENDYAGTLRSGASANYMLVKEPVIDQVEQLNQSKESGGVQPYQQNRIFNADKISPTIDREAGRPSYLVGQRIRRLTPLECFRLQGFPDEFFYNAKFENAELSAEILAKFPNHKGKRFFTDQERIERMSDSQLYKQAGNSITTKVIKAIIKNILPIILNK
jgi:DNA (cytosine-5)-methyltransferase 1